MIRTRCSKGQVQGLQAIGGNDEEYAAGPFNAVDAIQQAIEGQMATSNVLSPVEDGVYVLDQPDAGDVSLHFLPSLLQLVIV